MANLFEYEFTPAAEGVLRGLSKAVLRSFYDDLCQLLADPFPNNKTKRWINAPPLTAAHKQVARAGFTGFLVDYRFRGGKILVSKIQGNS